VVKKVLIGAAILLLLGPWVVAQRVAPSAAAPDAPPSRSFRLAVNGRLSVRAIAVDAGGNIYVAGGTTATDLPAANPEMPRRGTWSNAFVTKFDSNGRALWSSYIGGSTGRPGTLSEPGGSFALGIAVDPAGRAVIVGRTTATDFPVVNAFVGAAQATTFAYSDGFVAKLSGDGKRLMHSSYFGGGNTGSILSGVALGPAGEAWIAGSSGSNAIATQFDVSNRDSNHVIVLKLNPAGGVVWSTRMSGAAVYDLAVDSLGQPHIAAGCWSSQDVSFLSACSPFIAKLSASGSQQLYREQVSTGDNDPFRLSLGPTGQAVVAGKTGVSSTGDPWPSAWGLAGIGFVRMLDASGRTLSSNLVNATAVRQDAVHVLASDRLIVAFNTTTARLPTERALVSSLVDGPLFISDDGAATWAHLGGSQTAQSIHVNPEGEQLFAVSATLSSRSDDGGRTWRADSANPFFAIDPRQSRIHWKSEETTRGPVLRRIDGGAWQSVGPTFGLGPNPANTVTTLAVNPHDSSAWLGGEFGVEIFPDEGRSSRFENEGLPLPSSPASRGFARPRTFVFDPYDPRVAYVATAAGFYGRFEAGAAWTNLTSQLPPATPLGDRFDVIAGAVDPVETNILLIGRRDGAYRSIDRGRSWQQVLSGTEVRAIVADPNRPGVVYLSGNSIYRSLDHGATWQLANGGYVARSAPLTLAINPKTSRLYASSETLKPIAFVMEVTGSGSTYARPWATYLEDGEVFDVAATPSGAAVVGLLTLSGDRGSEVTIVRIGQ
jgi:hypothetical protein